MIWVSLGNTSGTIVEYVRLKYKDYVDGSLVSLMCCFVCLGASSDIEGENFNRSDSSSTSMVRFNLSLLELYATLRASFGLFRCKFFVLLDVES